MKEEFKDIKGYEGLYQISNFGKVKSLKFGKERLLKPVKNTWGYLKVSLSKNGKMKFTTIHRLVAETFLPNPNNLPQINHKDENKTNNMVENLEWCSAKYNNNHGTKNKRMLQNRKNKNTKTSEKQIDQFTKEGRLVKTWNSSMEAARNGYTQPSIISCCKGRNKSHQGFIWKYHK